MRRHGTLNELISFEVEAGSDGRGRAVRIMRTGQPKRAAAVPARERRAGWLGGSVVALGIAVIAVYGFSRLTRPAPPVSDPAAELAVYEEVREQAPPKYASDGRTLLTRRMTTFRQVWDLYRRDAETHQKVRRRRK